jgi:hypothetical protein
MNGIWLKAFSILWLTIVTPLLGVLPLLILLAEPDSLTNRYGVTILRDLRRLILPDPAPGASHVALSDLAPEPVWWVVIPAVFSVATLSLCGWYAYSRKKRGNVLR